MNLRHRIRGAPALRMVQRAAYIPPLAAALALLMGRLLAAARLLEISDFAEYSACLLVSGSFCMLGCLGLQTLLQRDLPILLLRGQARWGLVMAMQAGFVAIGCALVATVAGTLVANSGQAGLSEESLLTGILHGLTQQLFVLVTIESRSRGMPLLFAAQYLARAASVVALGIAVMATLGSGAWSVMAESIATLGVVAAVLIGTARRSSVKLRVAATIALRRIGAIRWGTASLLLAVSAASWLAHNSDRWVAKIGLDLNGFASYAFATNALALTAAAQMIINASVFPSLARVFAQSGRTSAYRAATSATLWLAFTGLLAAPAAWACWRSAVRAWFPQYEETVSIAPVIIALGVLRVSDFWSSFLIIVGAGRALLLATLIGLLLATLIWGSMRQFAEVSTIRDVASLALCMGIATYACTGAAAWKESKR